MSKTVLWTGLKTRVKAILNALTSEKLEIQLNLSLISVRRSANRRNHCYGSQRAMMTSKQATTGALGTLLQLLDLELALNKCFLGQTFSQSSTVSLAEWTAKILMTGFREK
ncbi:Hypothetical_protein [Hexamita inflata]|uniref:Hypothetical_protein n=1 Tax=Hexamita inflata TaxID=28002 RepID=A0AA86PY47_9EUKA|nr:Hypothetical protein HINF_LOCUS29979 [Hexamita inflata]